MQREDEFTKVTQFSRTAIWADFSPLQGSSITNYIKPSLKMYLCMKPGLFFAARAWADKPNNLLVS